MAIDTNNEYAFDLTLKIALRVNAPSFDKAAEILTTKLDAADANFGHFDGGDPILAEASLACAIDKSMLYEVNGEPAIVCPDCLAIEGEPAWGTVGDGFDGYCGSCADKREAAR